MNMTWRMTALMGLLGLALGLAVLVISSLVMFAADRISGGKGVAGLAAAATAGNAAAVPALVAAANPAYAAWVRKETESDSV